MLTKAILRVLGDLVEIGIFRVIAEGSWEGEIC